MLSFSNNFLIIESRCPLPIFTFLVSVRHCPNLPSLSHGNMSCTAGRSLGSVCSVMCPPGHTLLGSAERTCSSSGLWSGTMFSCVKSK